METINDRIQSIVKDDFSGNVSEFERASNIKPSTIKNIISGRKTKPSYDVLESIIRNNVLISAHWLMTGEGEKYKQNIQNKAGESCKNTVKIVVELEISKGEFDDMGLKDKVIQALGK